MKTKHIIPVIGFLAASVTANAQTGGQSENPFSSPDIYNTGKTQSKTLPPESAKTPGVAPVDTALKRTLQDIYNKCVAATKKRDESVLAALRTQDFTYKDAKGKAHSRADIEAGERQTLASAVTIDKVSSLVESVEDSGSKVTATLHHYFAATINDAQSKPHAVTLNTTSHETWITLTNAWKLQSVKVIAQNETMDGKPYNPTAQNNNQNRANRQTGSSNGYTGYRPPRTRSSKIRTIGGRIITG